MKKNLIKVQNTEIIPVCAYTPPPNGTVKVDGEVVKTYDSFHTYERYLEYRACGFTEILFAGEDKYQGEQFESSHLREMMDLAEKADLKAIVFDERLIHLTVKAEASIIAEFFNGDEKAFQNFVADCLKDYAKHPAFYGVSVVDEPRFAKHNLLKEMTNAIELACPNCFVMTCLLPCVQDLGLVPKAFGDEYNGRWENYRNYGKVMSEAFGYFHYDCYPFGMWEGKNCVAHQFIRNMQEAAGIANMNGVPFHMTVQSFSSGANDELRKLDEQDIAWQLNLSLGFGVSKIYYFTYWRFTTRTTGHFTSAIIEDDGSKIIYDEVQAGNRLLQKTARYTQGYQYLSTDLLYGGHENDGIEELIVTKNEYVKDYSVEATSLLNTLEKDGKKLLFLLNLRDPFEKETNKVRIELAQKVSLLEIIRNGEKLKTSVKDNALEFVLNPGEAVWIFME